MPRMDVDRAARIDIAPVNATILDVAAMLALAMADERAASDGAVASGRQPADEAGALHAGVWISTDGAVRLDLHPNGRYALRIAGRHRRTEGTYRADRLTVLLESDGGLRTTAQLTDDTLHLAGNPLHCLP